MDQVIGQRPFLEGIRRPIYEDAQGQYVLDNTGERACGLYRRKRGTDSHR